MFFTHAHIHTHAFLTSKYTTEQLLLDDSCDRDGLAEVQAKGHGKGSTVLSGQLKEVGTSWTEGG